MTRRALLAIALAAILVLSPALAVVDLTPPTGTAEAAHTKYPCSPESFQTTGSDGFEDGDAIEWNGDVTVTDAVSYSGTYSGELRTGTNYVTGFRVGSEMNGSRGDTFIFHVWQNSTTTQNYYFFVQEEVATGSESGYRLYTRVGSDGGKVGIRRMDSGSATVIAENTSADLAGGGQWLTVMGRTYSGNNTIQMKVWNESGVVMGTVSATDANYSSGGVGLGLFDENFQADDILVGYCGESTTSSSGVSQTITYQDNALPPWDEQTVTFSVYKRATDSELMVTSLGSQAQLVDSKEENWEAQATFDGLSNDNDYRLTLTLAHSDARYDVIGWRPETKPDPWIVKLNDGSTAAGTLTESEPGTITTDWGGGGGGTISFTPPEGEEYEYGEFNFTSPNGTTYTYNQTWSDGTSWYGANYTDSALPVEEPEGWTVDYSFQNQSGTWYNGTMGLSDTSTFGDSSVFGGGGPMQQGGDGGTPVSLLVLIIAGVGAYYYRKPGRRQELTGQLQAAGGRLTDLAGRLQR